MKNPQPVGIEDVCPVVIPSKFWEYDVPESPTAVAWAEADRACETTKPAANRIASETGTADRDRELAGPLKPFPLLIPSIAGLRVAVLWRKAVCGRADRPPSTTGFEMRTVRQAM